MSTDGTDDEPPDLASVADPGELLEVQAGLQRYLAARTAAEAAETDLVRLVAQAKAADLPDELICDRIAELGVMAEQLPRGLRIALGYTGPAGASLPA
jgi:hypothetical protein